MISNKFFTGLVLATTVSGVIVTPATASNRHRFVVLEEGNKNMNPHKLAELIRASLAKDASGKSLINQKSCETFKACATLNDYIVMLKEREPEVNLNLENLAAYYDSLVKVTTPPPTDRYWSSCKTGISASARPILNCHVRAFVNGEEAYADPLTKRIVFQSGCANVVSMKDVPVKCISVDFALKPGEEVHIGNLGPEAFVEDKDCLTALQKSGETDLSGPPADECPRDQCDFSQVSHEFGLKIQGKPRVSFKAENASVLNGTVQLNRLRLSGKWLESKNELVFCVIDASGRHTKSEVITRQSYRRNAKGEYVAYIAHSQEFVPDETWLNHNGIVHIWTNVLDGKAF